MTDVVELAKQLTRDENLHGMCSRLIWRIGMHQEAGWDVGTSYGNATAAYNACKAAGLILSTDLAWVNAHAEVGWIVYFVYRDAKNNGHVGIIVGRINGRAVMVSMTGNRAGLVADLGNGLFLSYVDGYSASRPFLGVSKHHGVRNRIGGLTSPYASTAPAGGGGTPFDSRKDEKMIHFYTKDGPVGSNGMRYHILHSGGVYTYTSGGQAFPNAVAAQIGSAIECDAAFIEAMKRQHAEQNPGGVTNVSGGSFDVSAIVAAIEKLGVKLDGLPAEIDQYADGKKNT